MPRYADGVTSIGQVGSDLQSSHLAVACHLSNSKQLFAILVSSVSIRKRVEATLCSLTNRKQG